MMGYCYYKIWLGKDHFQLELTGMCKMSLEELNRELRGFGYELIVPFVIMEYNAGKLERMIQRGDLE